MRYSLLILSFLLFCCLNLLESSLIAQPIITPGKRRTPAVVGRKETAQLTKRKVADVGTWSVIYMADKRIGYTHTHFHLSKKDKGRTLSLTEKTRMTFKRFGQPITIETSLITTGAKNGDLKSYEFQVKSTPSSVMTSSGIVQDKQLKRTTTIAGQKKTTTQPWGKSIKIPRYELHLLKQSQLQPGRTIRFESFEPVFNKMTTVSISFEKFENVKLLDGKKHRLLRAKLVFSVLPETPTTVWLNKQGDVLRSESDFLGKKMVTYQVKPEVALKEIAGNELDLAVSTLIKVNKIQNDHFSKRVIYQIKTSQLNPARFFSEGETQSIQKIDDETVNLTVVKINLSKKGKQKKPNDSFLKPSPYLQSRDVNVRNHALRAAGNRLDRLEVAYQMEKYVNKNLKEKNFSTALASAAEVAKNLEGDCTEHAMLLAAMLRVKKIPSRVAVGLVYVTKPSVFAGHMWTEAYVNGHWVPLDATLGRGGIGAAHIKLGDSSFAEDAPAPVTLFVPMMTLMNKIQITVLKSE